MYVRLISVIAVLDINTVALAKGLDELGQSNPEASTENQETDESGGRSDKNTGSIAAPNQPTSALGQAIRDKLLLGTSFGWVKASKSTGEWQTSGVSDLSISYQIAKINGQMNLLGTFRYTPIAVTGIQEKHSYRGVWEVYNFGALATHKLNSKFVALGSGEIGYVKSSLNPIDGLPEVESHTSGGATLTLGGGADFAVTETSNFLAGPRIFAGFGTYSVFQLSAAASFLF